MSGVLKGARIAGDVLDGIAIVLAHLAKVAAALAVLPLLVSCTNPDTAPTALQARPAGTQMAATPALVPLPAHIAMQSGQFVVGNGTPLVFDKTDAESARIAANFADLVLSHTRH